MTPALALSLAAASAVVLALLGARAALDAGLADVAVLCLAYAGLAAAVALWPEDRT